MTAHAVLPRHPGLVPGSNARLSEKLEPLVHDARHFGPRHKPVVSDAAGGVERAGVTASVRASAGASA